MIIRSAMFAAPALVLLMGGTAHAALTADQVWQGWKDAAAGAGATLSAATEGNDGGVLTLNGVMLKPASGNGAAVTVEVLSLTEQDDGSVSITPGGDIKMDMPAETGSGMAVISGEAISLDVSEGETGMDYALLADVLRLAVDMQYQPGVAPAEGQTAENATTVGNLSLTGLEAGWAGAAGDNQSVAVTLDADVLAYDVVSKDASLGVSSTQTSESTDVGLEATMVLPKTMALAMLTSPEAFSAALKEGMALDGTMTQAATKGTTKEESPMMPVDITFSSGAGTTEFGADADGVSVSATGETAEILLTSPAIPVPQVKLNMAAMEMGMTMPLIATETAGDYGLKLKLTDLLLNEEAWGLFDPNKVLPRDPAQLSLDLGGKATVDFLALAAAQNAGMTQVAPPLPESFDVRELLVQVAGASLTGTGAFTFDNSAAATGGAPVPVGTADVQLSGGNKLIDGLVATGLLTEQDAAGPRMMMGAFMSPGEGEDVLTSKIEAKADGQILVNGQRVQ